MNNIESGASNPEVPAERQTPSPEGSSSGGEGKISTSRPEHGSEIPSRVRGSGGIGSELPHRGIETHRPNEGESPLPPDVHTHIQAIIDALVTGLPPDKFNALFGGKPSQRRGK